MVTTTKNVPTEMRVAALEKKKQVNKNAKRKESVLAWST
jgi:hypothetical protein